MDDEVSLLGTCCAPHNHDAAGTVCVACVRAVVIVSRVLVPAHTMLMMGSALLCSYAARADSGVHQRIQRAMANQKRQVVAGGQAEQAVPHRPARAVERRRSHLVAGDRPRNGAAVGLLRHVYLRAADSGCTAAPLCRQRAADSRRISGPVCSRRRSAQNFAVCPGGSSCGRDSISPQSQLRSCCPQNLDSRRRSATCRAHWGRVGEGTDRGSGPAGHTTLSRNPLL